MPQGKSDSRVVMHAVGVLYHGSLVLIPTLVWINNFVITGPSLKAMHWDRLGRVCDHNIVFNTESGY